MENFRALAEQLQNLTDLWEPSGFTGVFSPDGEEIDGFCSGFAVHDDVSLGEDDRFYITLRAPFLLGYCALLLKAKGEMTDLAQLGAKTLFSVEKKYIFNPLGIDIDFDRIADADCVLTDGAVVSAKDAKTDDVIAVSYWDMQAILTAIVQGKGLSSKNAKTLLSVDKDGKGICFEALGGVLVSSCQHMGYACNLYYDKASGISFLRMENEPQAFVLENGAWNYFNKQLRETVLYAGLSPKDVHFVRYGAENMDAAMDIQLLDDQRHFILDAPRCLARAYGLGKKAKTYVLREGKIAVGLCVLLIDKAEGLYEIDAFLIDHRLQGKGFGDLMLSCAVDKLRAYGAKRIIVGLSADNEAAKNLYAKHGFQVFEEDAEEILMEYCI